MRIFSVIFILFLFSNSLCAQYNMSNLTVYDCNGTLTDSEANALNPGWYDNNENFLFTICPSGAFSITIDFTSFLTEPINDYVIIYDGPDNTYPVLAGPFSGTSLPPQIVSNGCVTINFVSDVNVTSEGFDLNWQAQLVPPQPPVLNISPMPTCSATTLLVNLDQNIHCDSVSTSQITVGGQINQSVIATPLNCINDSTNMIQLDLNPGLNESGNYNIYFESYFTDECNELWDLSASLPFSINDCPLQVDLTASNTTICLGECVDLFTNVTGGDVSTYNYTWNPAWQNSPGIQTVCPSVTTQYIVTVDDSSPAVSASDTIVVNVDLPPVLQASFSICETDPALDLIAVPSGGNWSGVGVTNSVNGTFNPNGLIAGVYTVNYDLGACDEDLDITVLDVFAGEDISVCINTPVFNLNTPLTTSGGIWSGCSCIQSNGDIIVGSIPNIITAIYTLPNGCSDTLLVSVVNNISVQDDTTLCQQSGNSPLTYNPPNGVWSVLPDNSLLNSGCSNSIVNYPYQQKWENGIANWVHDPNNDFDWTVITGGTPSANTGPSAAQEGNYYIYTEASNPNFPYKQAAIISPCFNLSQYNNPVLNFWYHMFDGNSNNGINQGSFSVDVSIDNGNTWINDIWIRNGNYGNQWLEASVDLSSYNSTELLIRLRVITGDLWQSDVALDNLSVLGGPVTVDGNFITDVAISGTHNLIYSIQGCSEFLDVTINEIDAGDDQVVCPLQQSFNLVGSPNGGLWNGNNIINTSLGTFDPSISSGLNVITYSYNGCVDTSEIWVVDTELQIDSLSFCLNSGLQYLDMSLVPRTPWNGSWSGLGIVNSNFPGEFNPSIADTGIHQIIYEANTCFDTLIISVMPGSFLLDTLICSASSDIVLNAIPAGGYWAGNGIINNTTGLFSPSQLSVGTHYVGYVAPNSCVDTFAITIYDSPVLSMSGLDTSYCFIDSSIIISTYPAIGGVLSGNGVLGNIFNPALAGSGYHNIYFTYGSGNCAQTIDNIVFIGNEIVSQTYISNDSLCTGDIITIGSNASGGTGNYTFSWNNGLSNSFEHLISPTASNSYIVNISDGCSDNISDTIDVYVYSTFFIDFVTSLPQCYGDSGFAKVNVNPIGNYTYIWNNNTSLTLDSIYADVNTNYEVIVTDNTTDCSISDTISIPGYDNVFAQFSPNQTECLSLLSANFQFINNSLININQISSNSYWDFGDGNSSEYIHTESPFHTYNDTGLFNVYLYLENIGGCKDSAMYTVCVLPDNKFYIPNSFTPNGDACNDYFYAKGVGGFYSFNIKIFNRWGTDIIFESNEITTTSLLEDGNLCNSMPNQDTYYKMGTWDGIMINNSPAEQGVYPYIIEYKNMKDDVSEEVKGYIVLIR